MGSHVQDFNAIANGPLSDDARYEDVLGNGLEVLDGIIRENAGAGYQASRLLTSVEDFDPFGFHRATLVAWSRWDFIGVGYRVTATGDGYFFRTDDNRYLLVKRVSGVETILAIVATVPAASHQLEIGCTQNGGDTQVYASLNTGSGFNVVAGPIVDNDIADGQIGWLTNRGDSNGSHLDDVYAEDINGAVVATLTIAEDSATFGDTLSLTTTNLGPLVAWTASDGTNTINLLNGANNGNQSTVDIPALTADTNVVSSGNVTVRAEDGNGDFATDTFTLVAPNNMSVQSVQSGFDTTLGSYLHQVENVFVGDQVYYNTADFNEFDGIGGYEAVGPGTFPLMYVSSQDGFAQSYTITFALTVSLENASAVSAGVAIAAPVNPVTILNSASSVSVGSSSAFPLSNLNPETALSVGIASADPIVVSSTFSDAVSVAYGTFELKPLKRLAPHLRLNSIPIN